MRSSGLITHDVPVLPSSATFLLRVASIQIVLFNIFFPYLLFIRPSWLNEAICPADSGGGQSDLDRNVNKQAFCFELHVRFKLRQLVHIAVHVACSWKKQASLKQLFLV